MSTEQPWTVGRLLEWTSQHLGQKDVERPRLEAEILLAHALGCKRIELYTRYEDVAGDDDRKTYRELILERLEGCPVAYLVGRKEFYSLPFEVTRDVLIPRDDSECLVTECVPLARQLGSPRILDIGTGSGNLAVALAKQLPKAIVVASDISGAALDVARGNAERNGVEDRIRFVQADLFDGVPGETFDFVVSNPPYIPTLDIAELDRDVRDFEPRLALDGGPDGFVVFDRLIAEASQYLEAGGHLLVEIGSPQEAHAREKLGQRVEFELHDTILDGARLPRVVWATLR